MSTVDQLIICSAVRRQAILDRHHAIEAISTLRIDRLLDKMLDERDR